MRQHLEEIRLPEGALGRFAIVKLWPELKTAEDECIARITHAAERLGLECIEVNADGSFRSDPAIFASKSNVDFVIHLHYDFPKQYDAFSFVALWNPISFYHVWGYARCSRNITTHDDFLSCSSPAADDHVRRLIRGQATHLDPSFNLYHSTPGVMHPPTLGDFKLFYAGINWEALGQGRSRHQEVLQKLDTTGHLRIYGPTLFQGVRVWQGYQSYVAEVPFDGISMIKEISKCGIALALSSEAHKESALMSNRLFESLAAGALIICDENPFARRFFGDSLLYIDGRSPADQIVEDIHKHLDWARSNPQIALQMIAEAQKIFEEKFALTTSISSLYARLPARKQELAKRQNPPGTKPSVKLFMLMPSYAAETLNMHLHSIGVQEYENIQPVIVVDSGEWQDCQSDIEAAVVHCQTSVTIRKISFNSSSIHEEIKVRRPLGEVIQELLEDLQEADAFVVVAPNEKLYSNHVAVLAGALQRDPSTNCAATAAILLRQSAQVQSIHEIIDFGGINPAGPAGYGRFIFRTSGLPADMKIALPYLNVRPMAVLVGANHIVQQLPATITIDLDNSFNITTANEAAENEVIRGFEPKAFEIAAGFFVQRANGSWPTPQRPGWLSRRLNSRWFRRQIDVTRRDGLLAQLRKLRVKLERRLSSLVRR